MYQCLLCKVTYDLTDDHYKYISEQVKEHSVGETIIVCPGCNKKRIVGGEHDIMDGEEGVQMFGREFNSDDTDRELKEFKGIIMEDKGT